MKIVDFDTIDKTHWNERVSEMGSENVFMLSCYLEATCKDLKMLVDGDNQPVLPLPQFNKIGVNRLIHPLFNRAFSIVKENHSDAVKTFILNHYDFVELKIYSKEKKGNTYQVLDTSHYKPHENVKRMVKKALQQGYTIKSIEDFEPVLQIFTTEVLPKINDLYHDDVHTLKTLCNHLKKEGKLLTYGVFNRDVFLGGAVYITHKNRIIYLKGGFDEAVKKNGGMYLLTDYVIRETAKDFTIFDFGGSSVKNVAEFNRKFGTEDAYYSVWKKDKRPFWFKWLQKLKRNGKQKT